MARSPLPVGTAGSVSVKEIEPGRHRALCRYRDHDGRTRQMEAWGATPTAAKRALSIAVRDRSTPSSTNVTASTRIADLGELWLAQKESSKLEPQTVDIYRSAWRIVGPAMGKLRVMEVTPEAVDRFLGTVKPGRVLHVKLVLTGLMELAVRRGAITANPVTSAQVIATVRDPVKAVDLDSLHAVRKALADYMAKPSVRGRASPVTADVLELVIATGCRTSEVLAIRFVDVDMTAQPPTVAVTGTIARAKGKGLRRKPKPKTNAGIRALPLPPFAVDVLARRIAETPGHRPGDGVFVTKNGTWLSQQQVNRAWRKARAEAGLTWVTFRGCRKTVATLIARSAGDQAAADQLGHGTPKVTKAHYIENPPVQPDRSASLQGLAPHG